MVSANVCGAYITSGAFFLVFVAFNTAQALATTLMATDVANASLAALYGFFTLLCIITPKLVEYIGPKWSMLVGAIPYCLLVFSYVIPLKGADRMPLSIPVFSLVGISASMLWTGNGIYLGRASVREAAATGEPIEAVTSRLNGVFWAVFQFTGLTGLVASSLVQMAVGKDNADQANQYLFIALGVASSIGVCIFVLLPGQPPMSAAERAKEASERERLAVGGDLVPGSSKAGTDITHRTGGKVAVAGEDAMAVSADSPALNADGAVAELLPGPAAAGDAPAAAGGATLMSTLNLLTTSRRMQLMLPIVIYNGMSLGWFFAQFPGFYAPHEGEGRQLLPTDMVGFVQGSFYLSNSLLSLVFGLLVARVGRRPVVIMAGIFAVLFLTTMLVLNGTDAVPACTHPDGEGCQPVSYVIVFALSIAFSVSDIVWESQVPAILQSSTFFEDEADRDAAQGNLRMWQSFGFAAQLAMNIFVKDMAIQVGLLLAVIVIAVLCMLYMDSNVQRLDATRRLDATTPRTAKSEASDHLLS